jgi:hypothetical protein
MALSASQQRSIEGRIAGLEAQGVTQATADEVKAMTPRQRVEARESGRLLRYMSTPAHGDGVYRHSTAG